MNDHIMRIDDLDLSCRTGIASHRIDASGCNDDHPLAQLSGALEGALDRRRRFLDDVNQIERRRDLGPGGRRDALRSLGGRALKGTDQLGTAIQEAHATLSEKWDGRVAGGVKMATTLVASIRREIREKADMARPSGIKFF